MAEPILRLEGLCKDYGEGLVLSGLSLDVYPGEFLTLLGPSGCGKTTTLRIIAGLERPTAGRVLIDGTDVTGLPPEKRPVNTVFQNYALFPHMTVFQNIAYGLKVLGISKSEQKERVMAALSLVRLAGFERRMPSQLSGGQRQRVAIARAVVLQPKVLLLDEPLGALDLQLRRQMQLELKRLQKQVELTFIYITHDQEEALNMSDRIAVMHDGRFEQVGTPAEVYDRPRTSFVARFVGTANIVEGRVAENRNGTLMVHAAGGEVPALCCGCGKKAGDGVTLAVRSEHVEFCTEGGLPATVKEKTFAGGMLRIALALENGDELVASRHGIDIALSAGDGVRVTWAAQNAVPVDTHQEARA